MSEEQAYRRGVQQALGFIADQLTDWPAAEQVANDACNIAGEMRHDHRGAFGAYLDELRRRLAAVARGPSRPAPVPVRQQLRAAADALAALVARMEPDTLSDIAESSALPGVLGVLADLQIIEADVLQVARRLCDAVQTAGMEP